MTMHLHDLIRKLEHVAALTDETVTAADAEIDCELFAWFETGGPLELARELRDARLDIEYLKGFVRRSAQNGCANHHTGTCESHGFVAGLCHNCRCRAEVETWKDGGK